MYLIDSDYIIDFIKGKKSAGNLVNKLSPRGIVTSVICVCEVLEGLYYGDSPKKLRLKYFSDFLKNLEVIEVDLAVSNQFAKLRGSLRLKGELIDNFDLLIAATCLVNNLTLLTGNTKHFQRIRGLKIYSGD